MRFVGYVLLVATVLVTACRTMGSPVIPPSPASATALSATNPAPTTPAPSMTTPTFPPTLTATPTPIPQLPRIHELGGVITGLDAGSRAPLSLELLQAGDPMQLWRQIWPGLIPPFPERGSPVASFNVANGPWHASDLSLTAGLYILVPQAVDYVAIRKALVLVLPDKSVGFRYTDLNFEFLHPADAPSRLGVPLCASRPPSGGDYIIPPGTPSPTPTFAPPPAPGTLYPTPAWPAGTCYAGHFVPIAVPPAGLLGQVQGLGPGQTATITIYALSPAPQERYGVGPPPPPNGSWQLASGQGPLAVVPTLAPGSVLSATMTVGNGPWGLIDPDLRGYKYVIRATTAGDILWPKSYEIVLLTGKALGLASDVDFSTGTPRFSMTPVPTSTPFVIPTARVEEITLDQARQIPGFHLFEPAYLPAGFRLRRIRDMIGSITSSMSPGAPAVTSRTDSISLEYSGPVGNQEFVAIGQRSCVPGVLPPGMAMPPTPDLHPETVQVHGAAAVVNRNGVPPDWVTSAPGPHEYSSLEWWEKNECLAVAGSSSLQELTRVANSLR
jgi:hypothetical protein